jgi:hypothetical protein
MVVAGVVAWAAAPAATAQTEYVKPLAWYEDRAGVPDTVQFQDVAANDTVQLAVGRDAATDTAVVYRRAGGGWQPELITLPGGTSELVDVELAPTGAAAWAVGSSKDGDAAAQPFVLRVDDTGTWVNESGKLPDDVRATAVGVASASTATIGDSSGELHRVVVGGDTTTASAAAAAAINGVELFDAASGYAVAGAEAPDGNARIYELAPAPILEPTTPAPGSQVDVLGLAATATDSAVAFEATRTWRAADAGGWIAEPAAGLPATRRLNAVASVAGGEHAAPGTGWATEFLAGEAAAAEPAIWRRTRWGDHPADWTREAVPAGTPKLTGVAATDWDNAWAVGENGAVLRWWRPPDPEAEQAALEEAERQRQDEEARLLAEEEARLAEDARLAEEEQLRQEEEARRAAEQEAAAQEQPAPEPEPEPEAQPSAPPPPPVERDDIRMNGIVIDDSPAGPRRGRERTQRLLKNVRAVRRGRKLIISFRLTSRARVSVTAKRGRKVIAKTRMRTFRKGRRQIVMRFRGAPPSSLKVVVRRVPGANGNR